MHGNRSIEEHETVAAGSGHYHLLSVVEENHITCVMQERAGNVVDQCGVCEKMCERVRSIRVVSFSWKLVFGIQHSLALGRICRGK